MAGSVAGITYFRNRYASIVARNRTIPTDPATAWQTNVRTRFSAAVTAWQGLSSSNRQSWEFYALGTPWTNSLGDDVRLTGFSMYLAVRLAVAQIWPTVNFALLNTAYCTPGLNVQPEVTFSICTGGGSGFTVNLRNPHPTDNMRVGVQISSAKNTTVNFWAGPYVPGSYQRSSSIAPGASTAINYNTLTNGKRYFLRLRAWNDTQKTLVSSPYHVHHEAGTCLA